MRRSSAFLALPVVFAFACSDQPTALKEALPAPEFSSIAGSAASSYLIIANGRRLPQSLARNVQAAGGVITLEIPEIGVAVASSDSPDFGNATIRGASVVPDVNLEWIDPDAGEHGLAIGEFGNPPTSGDDDFFFDLQWGHCP